LLLNKGGLLEHQEKKEALLADLKEANPEVFQLISKNVVSKIAMSKNKPGQVLSNGIYTVTQRFFGFASMVSGVIFILISLFAGNKLALFLVSIVLVLTIGITMVYSYKISK